VRWRETRSAYSDYHRYRNRSRCICGVKVTCQLPRFHISFADQKVLVLYLLDLPPIYLAIYIQLQMPKHLPTFKHLISSSSNPPRPVEKPDKSVNQLIAASRSSDIQATSLREVPPHPIASGSRCTSTRPNIWVPGEGDTSVLVACGLRGDAPVHP
jgi:hypothetical protein